MYMFVPVDFCLRVLCTKLSRMFLLCRIEISECENRKGHSIFVHVRLLFECTLKSIQDLSRASIKMMFAFSLLGPEGFTY